MKKFFFIGFILVFASISTISYAESKVIIFNDSSWFKSPGKTAIEIEIDGKIVGKLQRKQYLETSVSSGSHKIALRHKEMMVEKYYEDIHSIKIYGDTVYLKVFAGFFSTNVEVIDELPAFFEKKYKKID